jgi:ketosteroid isomerase-like protein
MSEANVEVVRKLYAEWAQGNFGATRDYFDPEVEFQWIWPPGQRWTALAQGIADPEGRVHGLEQLYAVFVDWLKTWERFTVHAEEFIEVDDRVLVLYHRHARMRGTDSTLELEQEGATLWTLRDSKLVHGVDFGDRAEALEAAGLRE